MYRMIEKKKIARWVVAAYIALLVSFSTFVLMDTFVIEKAYGALETTSENQKDVQSGGTNAEVTDTTYKDANKEVTLTTYREGETTVYVADIALNEGENIKTALAQNTYGKNIKASTSETADENKAVLAVNGDFYGARNSGYVIRNGQLLRSEMSSSEQEDLVIYEDGNMEIIKEGDITAEELLEKGAVNVFSFGPGLIENGEIIVDSSDEVGKAMASNPRTAIGRISDNHYVLVVSDGRTSESEGLSLSELAQFMKGLGVTTAYNLDGGGSSTMYFNGNVVNNPTTNGQSIKEREVSDIVYV
ncbi:Exopolysaccharide biosynthesis protein [Peptostreptococcaceae bacterium pGA-8]|nr:Exopolysaccharide biosynthesis protein [Peptostreptococcaceae bacterium pGA-8]